MTSLVDPDFLVEAVATPWPREHIEAMAGGTSESMNEHLAAAFARYRDRVACAGRAATYREDTRDRFAE